MQINAQRIAAVRNWHIDQATESDDRPVAVLSFTVTESGTIRVRDVGIEPEHANNLMFAIKRAVAKLEIEAGDDSGPKLGLNFARRRRESDRGGRPARAHLVGL